MARSIMFRLLCLSVFSVVCIQAQQLKVPADAHEKVQSYMRSKGTRARSTLAVSETNALAKATAQQDNNIGVLPLFDPEIMEVAETLGASYCEVVAGLDFCDGDYVPGNPGNKLFHTLCPITCAQAAEEFCVPNEPLAAFYLAAVGLGGYVGDGTCKSMVALSKGKQITGPDTNSFLFCLHPALGLMCSEECNINCWSWPPPLTIGVYLPGCQDYAQIPLDMNYKMMENRAKPGDSTICPP